ncbi:hypothetical protein B296_00045820 [Ensete ventricosum]|uniref:WAT1-related protein n=1 Tax=Ensete ventricosum TaxID=4639 RepID=A0A426XBV2_ENSVE|nr:hypothetical protein B296_00045820 [Ensete ventricosum]
MEKIRCGQVSAAMKKGKKKQANGELDRLKQAEKKKRRLEKALATSAALRSELEQKKQKKIEEQKRLDEEGASVAEAVALHVLGGEDADESCHVIINNTTNSKEACPHAARIADIMHRSNPPTRSPTSMLKSSRGGFWEELFIVSGNFGAQVMYGVYMVFLNGVFAAGVNPLFLVVFGNLVTAVVVLPFAVVLEKYACSLNPFMLDTKLAQSGLLC